MAAILDMYPIPLLVQAGDFIKLGFLTPGTDIGPIIPALEKIWADSKGQRMADFNFRTVTSKFNELVYQVGQLMGKEGNKHTAGVAN
jgi:hypothetical protein